MFHLQKSSKSSDENLEINLLQESDRQSRVNIVRVNHRSIQTPVKGRNLKRGSEKIARRSSFNLESQPNIYDKYSALGGEKVDFSQSILTNASENNPFVGLILFILLIVFTPLQTLTLNGSQQTLGLDSATQMLVFLILCELIAFGVLYYFHYVQSFVILKKYLKLNKRNQMAGTSLISQIIIRPYLLFFLVICLTCIWEISYANIILYHDDISHLILFYVIILPQIAGSLYFEDELNNRPTIKIIFYITILYLFFIGFLVNHWLFFSAVTGVLLIYLSIRAGRMCLFMEYTTKVILFIVLLIWHFFTPPPYEYSPSQQMESQPIPMIFLLVFLSSIAMILVRCINNKVLRVELYKYFYSDSNINIALLCLPLIMGYLQFQVIDILVSVIGCGVLLVLNYKIDRYKQTINIDFSHNNDIAMDQSPTK